jgi:hypothetical protein
MKVIATALVGLALFGVTAASAASRHGDRPSGMMRLSAARTTVTPAPASQPIDVKAFYEKIARERF